MKIRTIILLLSVFFVSSCAERWEKMNTNPNSVIDLPDGYLFTSAIRESFLDNMNRVQGDYSGQYAHLITTDVYNREIDKYFDIHSSGDVNEDIFRGIYNGAILSISEVLTLTSEGKYKSDAKHAQASIIAAYNYSKMTDLFGDVPFSEAAQGKAGLLTPKYDQQEEIYAELVNNLDQSLSVLKASTAEQIYSSTYDPLFFGDLVAWQKFANSLRLRLAMRARFADPAKYQPIIAACLEEPLIETNEENVKLSMQDNANTSLYNPWYNKIIDYNASRVTIIWSQMFIETLRETQDPRLAFFASKNNSGNYIGMPNGLQDIPYSQWSKANTSKFTEEFVARDQPLYILTAAEIWLLRAEASVFAIGGEAEANDKYQTGISMAMGQWGISTEEIDAYLETEEATLNGSNDNKLRQIATQIWIGSVPNFLESWNTIRRTGYPKIATRENADYSTGVTNGILPKRLKYPYTVEKIANGASIQEAIDRMGGTDKIDLPVWWADKNN